MLRVSFGMICGLLIVINGSVIAQKPIRLTVGQSELVSVRGTITKVQVLNPRVADVATYTSRSATVVGVDAGSTELLIYTGRRTHKYQIVVNKIEVGRLFKQVRSFLGRLEGIYPRLIGDNIVLTGAALTADDYGRAQRAVKLFGNKVRNLVRFKPSAVEQVNRIFTRMGLTTVKAKLLGGALFLEGAVDSEAETEKVKAILRSYGLNVENLVQVGGSKQILIDVQFVELRKAGTENLGIQWPTRFGVSKLQGTFTGQIPVLPAADPTFGLSLSSPIESGPVGLNMLYATGKARLLAQPKLVCGSGKSAQFLVGGEVPVVVITNNVINITYKEFGIKLKVKPVADSLGNISSEILAEVSELDDSLTVQGVPGFRTRRFTTNVTVKEGASIVLSGLFSNSQQKSVDKLPLLGQIPILGELFKSRGFREQKTTLVVFVTPKVVTPQHPWVVKSIRDIQKQYGEYEEEVGWQVLD